MIGIIDYGVGNVGSVLNMLKRLRLPATTVGSRDELRKADRLILPGVGSFDHAMERLRHTDLLGPLNEQVLEHRIPTLGICLGMQLMANRSEEGVAEGLGWIPGEVKHFAFAPEARIKVPHMGWSYVDAAKPHPLVQFLENDTRYYFVHSYHYVPADPADSLMTCHYGGFDFVAGVVRGNTAAVQFHPEKSHRYGMALFATFAAWTPGEERA